MTTQPIVGQKCWKNKGGIPSGPSAFRGYICLKVLHTSFSWKSLVSISFMVVETLGWTEERISANSVGLDDLNNST